jgi:hypothetical protein
MPEPSHIAGVIANKRASCAASSHNHCPNTSEYLGGDFLTGAEAVGVILVMA